ncbi:helix-turn-helix transcriptional regulator [Paracoccus sp. (in: a-proteobacteria)]|uniref:helix-turn-helix transcriptional regulator n=1 Tax=Paracoccus sp. TaxID=267 RepID=UPI002AFEF003|nr:helix-turn-helix transcriptional regulator [Paracoccus sp. (in: a-proteobacteria)]
MEEETVVTGKELAAIRKAAGPSQTGLARRVGIGRHAVSYWKCKLQVDPYDWAVPRMAQLLDLSAMQPRPPAQSVTDPDATRKAEMLAAAPAQEAHYRAILAALARMNPRQAPVAVVVASPRKRCGARTRMHKRDRISGLTPYQVIGQLVRLRSSGEQPNDIRLNRPEDWNRDGFEERHGILRELVERVLEIGNPESM